MKKSILLVFKITMPLTMFFDVSIEKGKEKEVVFFLMFSHEV